MDLQTPSNQPVAPGSGNNTKVVVTVLVLVLVGAGAYFGVTKYQEKRQADKAEEFVENIFGEAFDGVEMDFDSTFDSSFDPFAMEESETVSLDASIGEDIEMEKVSLKLNSVEEVSSLDDGFGTTVSAGDGAKLLILNLSLTNSTNNPLTFWSDNIRFMDSEGRTFNNHADSWYFEDVLDGQELSPGLSKSGKMIFEVPEDAELGKLLVREDYFDSWDTSFTYELPTEYEITFE